MNTTDARSGAARGLTAAALLLSLASCASHDAHRVRIDLDEDLRQVVEGAVERLVDDHGEELATANTLLAVEVDDVDVRWAPRGDDARELSNVELRAELEEVLVRRMGDALVPAPREGDFWDAAEYLLQARLVLDLHANDALGLQLATFLVHREDPDRVLAYGPSDPLFLRREYCHGCRDHPFRRKGTRVRPPGLPDGYPAYGGYGFFLGYGFGYGYGHGHLHGGGTRYTTVR